MDAGFEFEWDPVFGLMDEEGLEAAAGPQCQFCGCTNERGCPGGCIWYDGETCSRCARRKGVGDGA
jgi:hypothetical protein